MSFLDTISETFGEGKLKKDSFNWRIRVAFERALDDGFLSNEEIARINLMYQESGLQLEEFQKICADTFTYLVQRAVADRRVTEIERLAVFDLADKFHLSDQWKQWAQQQIQYYFLFDQIESGGPLPVLGRTSVVLMKNEICHLYLPAQMLEEQVIRDETISNTFSSGSYVFRKNADLFGRNRGRSYSSGETRTRVEIERGLVPVSVGHFAVTNQRLVFSGNLKSISTDFDELLDVQAYADAISYATHTRQKPFIVQFGIPEQVELSALIISRLVSER